MTIVGCGGVTITGLDRTDGFERAIKRLPPEIQQSAKDALKALLTHPTPKSIRFHKLSGYKNPALYTIDASGNHSYKISFELSGSIAILRRIGTHKEIDRNP